MTARLDHSMFTVWWKDGEPDQLGLRSVVVGDYVPQGDHFGDGRKVYKNLENHTCLFFWDTGDRARGWWIAPEISGCQGYACCSSNTIFPPHGPWWIEPAGRKIAGPLHVSPQADRLTMLLRSAEEQYYEAQENFETAEAACAELRWQLHKSEKNEVKLKEEVRSWREWYSQHLARVARSCLGPSGSGGCHSGSGGGDGDDGDEGEEENGGGEGGGDGGDEEDPPEGDEVEEKDGGGEGGGDGDDGDWDQDGDDGGWDRPGAGRKRARTRGGKQVRAQEVLDLLQAAEPSLNRLRAIAERGDAGHRWTW